jgi:tetratricopeptide (TPR) repeat protein
MMFDFHFHRFVDLPRRILGRRCGSIIPAVVKVLIFVLLGSSSVFAQESPRMEKNEHGTLINQDYFTAREYTGTNSLITSVEANHLNQRVWSDFYAGKYNAVLSDVFYILDRFPNHPTALLLLGFIAKIKGELSMPIPYYTKALKLYPQYALIHAQSGMYLVEIGRFDIGIEKLEEAVRMDPKLVRGYIWLAKAYSKKGNPELAHHAEEKARALGFKGKIKNDDREETLE